MMRTLIRGVRVFDGESMVDNADVAIENDRISSQTTDHADTEIDGAGLTLIPGLIDAHTHVVDGDLSRALRHGVTTELDMFCLPGNLARQRRLAAERDDVADLRSAGILATAPGGHPSQIMQAAGDSLGDAAGPFPTVTDPKQFVADRLAEGIDYLKIVIDGTQNLPTLDPETVKALVQAGHDAGLMTIAHAVTAAEVRTALDAGIDGLAHVWIDAPDQELANRVAAQGVFVISTLTYFEVTAAPQLPDALRTIGMLHRAGAGILAGTDANLYAPQHGSALHRELELLSQAGLSATETLRAATSATAATFGMPDRGRIADGLRADLVLLNGKSIVDVWRRGNRLSLES